MNDEQKEWYRLFSSNLGTKEFVRIAFAIVIWVSIGAGASILLALIGYSNSNVVFEIFFFLMFFFPIVAISWRPAYSFLWKILGNKNLPKEPYPGHRIIWHKESRSWWSYLPGIWWILIDLILLYAVIKHFNK